MRMAVPDKIDLGFIAQQTETVLANFRQMRHDWAAMRATMMRIDDTITRIDDTITRIDKEMRGLLDEMRSAR
jgi:septation ring formation regulator EzrA